MNITTKIFVCKDSLTQEQKTKLLKYAIQKDNYVLKKLGDAWYLVPDSTVMKQVQ